MSAKQCVSAFSTWVKDHKTKGLSCKGEPADIVSFDHLKKYWCNKNNENLRQILDALELAAPANDIKKSFLRTFSTLVYADEIDQLREFTTNNLDDKSMPLERFPDQKWGDGSVHKKLFEKVIQYQWMFFPIHLRPNRLIDAKLHAQAILPITQRDPIMRRDIKFSSQVYKIKVEPSCHSLSKKKENNTFVLKVYRSKTQKEQYQNESTALTALRDDQHVNLITCFGTFTHGDTANILLEYAEGGNLLNYLQSTKPPDNTEDICRFWNSMLKLPHGLMKLHSMSTCTTQLNGSICGIHGDLKLDNILLSRPNNAKSNYEFEPKIADFGNAGIYRTTTSGDETGVYKDGNKIYSAPESNRSPGPLREGKLNITKKTDIFALGCIFSEVCIWLSEGRDGIKNYFEKRRAAASPSMTDGGYAGCFYSQDDVLGAVKEEMEKLRDCKNDSVHPATRDVAKIVLESMLVYKREQRSHILELVQVFQAVVGKISQHGVITDTNLFVSHPPDPPISNADNILSSGSTKPGPTARPPASYDPESQNTFGGQLVTQNPGYVTEGTTFQERWSSARVQDRIKAPLRLMTRLGIPSSPSAVPILTVEDVFRYRDEISKRPGEGNPNSDHGRLIERLVRTQRRRDQIFFIDNSHSMYEHREDVNRAFEALGYIAEQIDQDGIELFFGDPDDHRSGPVKSKKSQHLLEILKKHSYSVSPPSMLEDSLSDFVQNVILARLPRVDLNRSWIIERVLSWFLKKRPINIFVFTDGKWGADMNGAAGVEAPIVSLMKAIKTLGLNRTYVTIQFVQFGHDVLGKENLQYLDDFGDEASDIVDTEHFSGNVFKMFIGSSSREMDIMQTPREACMPVEDTASSYHTCPERHDSVPV